MFLLRALTMSFAMFWELLWALILGFALSGAVQAERERGLTDNGTSSNCRWRPGICMFDRIEPRLQKTAARRGP